MALFCALRKVSLNQQGFDIRLGVTTPMSGSDELFGIRERSVYSGAPIKGGVNMRVRSGKAALKPILRLISPLAGCPASPVVFLGIQSSKRYCKLEALQNFRSISRSQI